MAVTVSHIQSRLGSFDRLAFAYEWLEWIAFGSELETARFCHLDHLRDCQRALILGEGDGRFLERLVRRFPALRVDCVDASGAMLAKAKGRLTVEERRRVTFRHEDALSAEFDPGVYDAVVTMFFLDCFSTDELQGLIDRVTAALQEDASWLCADFALPLRGWRRWRAALWLRGMYLFFQWQTQLSARRLPPMEGLLRSAGWEVQSRKTLQADLLCSAVFKRS